MEERKIGGIPPVSGSGAGCLGNFSNLDQRILKNINNMDEGRPLTIKINKGTIRISKASKKHIARAVVNFMIKIVS